MNMNHLMAPIAGWFIEARRNVILDSATAVGLGLLQIAGLTNMILSGVFRRRYVVWHGRRDDIHTPPPVAFDGQNLRVTF